MHIRYGYNIQFEFAADTPIITMLDIHPTPSTGYYRAR